MENSLFRRQAYKALQASAALLFLALTACGGGKQDHLSNAQLEVSKASAQNLVVEIPDDTKTPGPDDLMGLAKSGRIDVTANDVVIEGKEISNPDGPCVVVWNNVHNVTIKKSRIGPCGPSRDHSGYGVFVLQGAHDVTVKGNVIHDVETGVKAASAKNPIVVTNNYIFNIFGGGGYNGQAVQFNSVSGGTAASKVNCNVSDATYGSAAKGYEDHISMFTSSGTASAPIEIAFNRVRGGTSAKGGGITVGDFGGGWINIHDNAIVTVTNIGITVAGGNNILVEGNRIDNRGQTAASLTYLALNVRALSSCSDITVRNNRGIARLWNWNRNSGELHGGYEQGPELCTRVVEQGNVWGDTSLSPAIFDTEPLPCLPAGSY